MDIERLKELRKKIPEYYGNGFMSLVHCDNMLDLIDDAIARQSVKSEEVQEAIDILQAIRPSEKEIKSGEYPDVADAIDIAITTLQAYKPWVSVEDRLPEDRRAVLVWEPMYKNIFTMYWEEGQWFFFGGGGQLNCEITHWKPLPEPPKGE